ncbi:MAG: hypothetical protein STHCBS139747_004365 [Sporothrix thermara]
MATASASPAVAHVQINLGDDGRPLYFEDLSAMKLPPAASEFGDMPDKRIPDFATLRAQASSPLVQYEYVAVDCEGQEADDCPFIDEKGITHIGLAYMPSSVPPPLAVESRDEQGKTTGLQHVPSDDKRRLEGMDLDDIVATYGVQAASTRLRDRVSSVVREQFRYGKKDQQVTAQELSVHLSMEVERLDSVSASRVV